MSYYLYSEYVIAVNFVLIFIPNKNILTTTITCSIFTLLYSTIVEHFVCFPETINNIFENQENFMILSYLLLVEVYFPILQQYGYRKFMIFNDGMYVTTQYVFSFHSSL